MEVTRFGGNRGMPRVPDQRALMRLRRNTSSRPQIRREQAQRQRIQPPWIITIEPHYAIVDRLTVKTA